MQKSMAMVHGGNMRIELIHPIIIHFPLALLLTGVVLRLVHFFLRKSSVAKLSLRVSWVFLTLGVCFAWIAIIAGALAADIVAPTLCNPHVLEKHSTCAYTAASLFTAAVVIDGGRAWKKRLLGHSRLLSALMVLLYLSGTVFLVLAGFYGGSLVYEQGAAVHRTCH